MTKAKAPLVATPPMPTHAKLRAVRESNRLSLATVARALGLSHQLYTKYEGGKTQRIPAAFIHAFADYFRVSGAWLIGVEVPVPQTMLSNANRAVANTPNLIETTAYRLHIPAAFLRAVLGGEVVGNDKLYRDIATDLGLWENEPAPTENPFSQFITRLRADFNTPVNEDVINLLKYYVETGKLCARALKLLAPTTKSEVKHG